MLKVDRFPELKTIPWTPNLKSMNSLFKENRTFSLVQFTSVLKIMLKTYTVHTSLNLFFYYFQKTLCSSSHHFATPIKQRHAKNRVGTVSSNYRNSDAFVYLKKNLVEIDRTGQSIYRIFGPTLLKMHILCKNKCRRCDHIIQCYALRTRVHVG